MDPDVVRRVVQNPDLVDRLTDALTDGEVGRVSEASRGLREATHEVRTERKWLHDINNRLLNGCVKGVRQCVKDIKIYLSATFGYRFYMRKRNGRLYVMQEHSGGGDEYNNNARGEFVHVDDGYDVFSVSCVAVQEKYPRIVIRIGWRTIADAYFLWSGDDDGDFAYRDDVKTVELEPSCIETEGEVDNRGFRWAGTMVFRSNGAEVHRVAYNSDPRVLHSCVFLAFLYADMENWTRYQLSVELFARDWLREGRFREVYRQRSH